MCGAALLQCTRAAYSCLGRLHDPAGVVCEPASAAPDSGTYPSFVVGEQGAVEQFAIAFVVDRTNWLAGAGTLPCASHCVACSPFEYPASAMTFNVSALRESVSRLRPSAADSDYPRLGGELLRNDDRVFGIDPGLYVVYGGIPVCHTHKARLRFRIAV